MHFSILKYKKYSLSTNTNVLILLVHIIIILLEFIYIVLTILHLLISHAAHYSFRFNYILIPYIRIIRNTRNGTCLLHLDLDPTQIHKRLYRYLGMRLT